jgi:hypothetical protein
MHRFYSERSSLLLGLCVLGVFVLGIRPSYSAPEDVPMSHWARDSVKEISDEYKFMKGDPNGNFRGTSSVSRYELAVTLSRMLSFFNSEFDSSREDLNDVVSVMELFQNELKVLEDRNKEMSLKIQELDSGLSELNILISEIKSGKDLEKDELLVRVKSVEELAQKANEKGFFVDTLIMGPVNDVKHIVRAASGDKENETEILVETEVKSEIVEPQDEEIELYDSEEGILIEEIEGSESL